MENKNISVTTTAKHIMDQTLLPCPSSGMKCPCGGCPHKYSGICLRPKPCIICDKDLLRVRGVEMVKKI